MARYKIIKDVAGRFAGDEVEFVKVAGKRVVFRGSGGIDRTQFSVTQDVAPDCFELVGGDQTVLEREVLTTTAKKHPRDNDEGEEEDIEEEKSSKRNRPVARADCSTLNLIDRRLMVISWNIKDFSESKVKRPSARQIMLNVLLGADIVFILEVVSGKRAQVYAGENFFDSALEDDASGRLAMKALCDELNKKVSADDPWDFRVSNINASTAKCDAYGMLFRPARVSFVAGALLPVASYENRVPWEVQLTAGATKLVFFVWHAAYNDQGEPDMEPAFRKIAPVVTERAAAFADVDFVAVTGDFNWSALETVPASQSQRSRRPGQTSGTMYQRFFAKFALGIHRGNCGKYRDLRLGTILDRPDTQTAGIRTRLYDNFLLYTGNKLMPLECAIVNMLEMITPGCANDTTARLKALTMANLVSDHLPVRMYLPSAEAEISDGDEEDDDLPELEDAVVLDEEIANVMWEGFDAVDGQVKGADDAQYVQYADAIFDVLPVDGGGECFYRSCALLAGVDAGAFAQFRTELADDIGEHDPDAADRIRTAGEMAGLDEIRAMAVTRGVQITVHGASYSDDQVTHRRTYNEGAAGGHWHVLFQYDPVTAQGHISPMVLRQDN